MTLLRLCEGAGDSGGEGVQKGRSLADRLLSKKTSRRTEKLTFGSNAQVSGHTR